MIIGKCLNAFRRSTIPQKKQFIIIIKDGLPLIDREKALLADSFYSNNNIFLETHTHHFQMGAELHLLQKDRRHYLNNPLIGYLNINSVRNK